MYVLANKGSLDLASFGIVLGRFLQRISTHCERKKTSELLFRKCKGFCCTMKILPATKTPLKTKNTVGGCAIGYSICLKDESSSINYDQVSTMVDVCMIWIPMNFCPTGGPCRSMLCCPADRVWGHRDPLNNMELRRPIDRKLIPNNQLRSQIRRLVST